MSFFLLAESWSRYGTGNIVPGTLLDNMLYRYTTVTGGEIGSAFGRNGNGIRLSNATITKTHVHSNVWTVGFAVKFPAPTDNNDTIYSIRNNDRTMFQLRHNTDQTLTMIAGANLNLIGTTDRALLNGRWYYVDFNVQFSGSGPITCDGELRINGNIEASGSASTDWTSSQLISGDNKANRQYLSGLVNAQSVYYDDFYFKNTAGYYGDVRIIALYPNGEGGSLMWNPATGSVHYIMVNTHPVDITKFVQTATPGDIDTYEWEDIPGFSGIVKAVNMGFLLNKDDEGTKSAKIVFGSTGLDEESDEFFVSSDTPEYFEHSNENDPATGMPWTQAGWNATQAGIKLVS